MRKLRRNIGDDKLTEEEFKYLPMFFESMISYLSYKLNRDETLQSLNKDELPISDKLKKYLELLDLTARFGSNSALKRNDKDDLNLTHLSMSSTNTPKVNPKLPSMNLINNKMPSINKLPLNPKKTQSSKTTFNRDKDKELLKNKTEEPIKNFSTYFNKLQNQDQVPERPVELKEFKKELKMIIKDAKMSIYF